MEERDGQRQIRGWPDRGLEHWMVVTLGVRKGRDGRGVVVPIRRGLPWLVVIRGEGDMRERVPDFPGRLNRAREDKQTQGNQARHPRSWHGTTIASGNREWQLGWSVDGRDYIGFSEITAFEEEWLCGRA